MRPGDNKKDTHKECLCRTGHQKKENVREDASYCKVSTGDDEAIVRTQRKAPAAQAPGQIPRTSNQNKKTPPFWVVSATGIKILVGTGRRYRAVSLRWAMRFFAKCTLITRLRYISPRGEMRTRIALRCLGSYDRTSHHDKKDTSNEVSYRGEANALISELFSISSNSSLVGTVTGSFLKLKVITSLSS